MPFQDIDDIATAEVPRAPTGIERILRKLFVEDWSLKLLSLAVTLGLWFAVTGQNTPTTTHANVQIKYIQPDSLEISNDPPNNVQVLLTGSRHNLDRLSEPDLVATVDLSDQRAGERVVRLTDRARMPLPDGVKIDSFQPGAITLRLEPVVDKQVEVEVQVEGTPAEGYEVYAVHPSSSYITLHGPASHVEGVRKAQTEIISVAGRMESLSVKNIAIDISDPKIDVLDRVIDVDIEIGEHRKERSFSSVPVIAPNGFEIQPRMAFVVVYGSATAVERLQESDIKLVADVTGNTVTPRLDLPSEFREHVTLKSLTPSQFIRLK
ncbi:MAG: YbbR-like domain-containing protein [Pyrinomonadaceae bacterium]